MLLRSVPRSATEVNLAITITTGFLTVQWVDDSCTPSGLCTYGNCWWYTSLLKVSPHITVMQIELDCITLIRGCHLMDVGAQHLPAAALFLAVFIFSRKFTLKPRINPTKVRSVFRFYFSTRLWGIHPSACLSHQCAPFLQYIRHQLP